MTKELAIQILRGEVLGTNEQTHEAVFMAIKALKNEQKHGKWIKHVDEECEEANWYECPNCHRFKRIATLYCPFCGSKNEGYEWADNCGAKMERSEDEYYSR